jgi:hypothetical protein
MSASIDAVAAADAAGLPVELADRLTGDTPAALADDALRPAESMGIDTTRAARNLAIRRDIAAADAQLANAATSGDRHVALNASMAANGALLRDLISNTDPATGRVKE